MLCRRCDRCGKIIDLDSSGRMMNGHPLEYGFGKQEICDECWHLLQKFMSTKGNLDLLLALIWGKIGVEPYDTFHIKEEDHNSDSLLYRFDDMLSLQYENCKSNWMYADGYTLRDFLAGKLTLDIVDKAN